MKKTLAALTILAGVLAVAQAPALAGGIGHNTIGPSVRLGNGNTIFSIDGKFGVADNISLRPYVAFPSGGTNFGTSLTYDFDLRQSATPITPFIGAGVDIGTNNNGGASVTTGFAQVGADFNINEQFALLGAVNIPFNSNSSTNVTLGAGLRF
jgi:opacity protein-like surface antigen